MKNISTSEKIKAHLADWMFIIVLFCVTIPLIMLPLQFFCHITQRLDILDNEIFSDIVDYGTIVLTLVVYPMFKDLMFECGSVGCRIFKIKIVNDSGEKPTKRQLILRGCFFHMIWIDIFVSMKRLDNRSLTDIITKTRQIKIQDM